ncbi:MAG: hypothetical protein ACODAD_15900 [Planctomycetota bacterium]
MIAETITVSGSVLSCTFEYDAAGQLSPRIDRNGRVHGNHEGFPHLAGLRGEWMRRQHHEEIPTRPVGVDTLPVVDWGGPRVAPPLGHACFGR